MMKPDRRTSSSFPPFTRTTLLGMSGRRLVVVDIENLVGGAVMSCEQAGAALDCVRVGARLRGDEHVVVGTSHVGLLPTGLAWPGSRLVVRSGVNGADLALLDVLESERVAERFSEVVIVSGDAIFTDATARLGASGVGVTVMARRGSLSKRLRLAAASCILLGPLIRDLGGAA